MGPAPAADTFTSGVSRSGASGSGMGTVGGWSSGNLAAQAGVVPKP
jgi:hypothetical protein